MVVVVCCFGLPTCTIRGLYPSKPAPPHMSNAGAVQSSRLAATAGLSEMSTLSPLRFTLPAQPRWPHALLRRSDNPLQTAARDFVTQRADHAGGVCLSLIPLIPNSIVSLACSLRLVTLLVTLRALRMVYVVHGSNVCILLCPFPIACLVSFGPSMRKEVCWAPGSAHAEQSSDTSKCAFDWSSCSNRRMTRQISLVKQSTPSP